MAVQSAMVVFLLLLILTASWFFGYPPIKNAMKGKLWHLKEE